MFCLWYIHGGCYQLLVVGNATGDSDAAAQREDAMKLLSYDTNT